MAPVEVEENVSLFFSHPTQDDYERAKNKARELLCLILPKEAQKDLEEKGLFKIIGKRGIYIISPYCQTEIRDLESGICVAYGCLQLSIPAPTYDRMVAEYLLIKNSEDTYWKTANIFSRSGNELNIATLILILFDTSLLINLLWEILKK